MEKSLIIVSLKLKLNIAFQIRELLSSFGNLEDFLIPQLYYLSYQDDNIICSFSDYSGFLQVLSNLFLKPSKETKKYLTLGSEKSTSFNIDRYLFMF